MKRITPYGRLALVAFAWVLMANTAAAEKLRVHDRISIGGKVIDGRPIDIGVDHQGVKLEAITFANDEANLVIWNRTPHKVNLNAGIALFDKGGLLIAAQSDDRPITRSILSIKSGKQANLKIKLKKFLSDVSEASQFRLVVAMVETEEW